MRGEYAVRGFWQAGGPAPPLAAWQRAGNFTADLFGRAVDEFCQELRGPSVLVLDNASVHRAHAVQRRAEWEATGLTFLFFYPLTARS